VLGLVGSLVTGASVFGQIERGFNRLYGIEQDRPSVRKYGRGLLLAVTAGTCSACAFGLVALGDSIEETSQTGWIRRGAGVAGWPLAIVAVTAAVTMLMRWCPRRHQPGPSWLAYGSAVSVLGWLIVTFGLRAVFHLTSTFGDTYGPLAGMVALLVWSLLSAIALLYGVAVTAQLEAARAGRPGPTDAVKVARSEAGELTSAQS
jgi:uncharacterized BrkB/YihY/UPF0761 family membrane protein